MPEYVVTVPVTQTVEADSPEKAVEIALRAIQKSGDLWWPSVQADEVEEVLLADE